MLSLTSWASPVQAEGKLGVFTSIGFVRFWDNSFAQMLYSVHASCYFDRHLCRCGNRHLFGTGGLECHEEQRDDSRRIIVGTFDSHNTASVSR